jgi:hypothetical protein
MQTARDASSTFYRFPLCGHAQRVALMLSLPAA